MIERHSTNIIMNNKQIQSHTRFNEFNIIVINLILIQLLIISNISCTKSKYINPESCSVLSQTAILLKGFPVEYIHSCKEKIVELESGEIGTVVQIHYGPLEDCQSGCGFSWYSGIFVDGRQTLVDLRIHGEGTSDGEDLLKSERLLYEYLAQTEAPGMHSHIQKFETNGQAKIGNRNGHFGWILIIDSCWYTLISPPDKSRHWKYHGKGEVFLYINNGSEVWDFTKFQVVMSS